MPAFAGTFLGVSTLLITSRLYLRVKKQAGAFGLDDLLVGIGWLFSVGFTIAACIGTQQYGLDRHIWDVNLELAWKASLIGWICELLWFVSICATKCSVLLFYRRLVYDTGDWKYAIWTALALTAGYFVAMLLALLLACRPLEAYWLAYDLDYAKSYTCVNSNASGLVVGIGSVISDLYAVILPFVILRSYSLNVPRRQTIGLNLIFSLSLLVAGAGIARTYYLWQVGHQYDITWQGFDLLVCSIVECHLAIIFTCAPSLRVFFRQYLGDSLSRSFRSSRFSGAIDRAKGSKTSSAPTDSQKLPSQDKHTSALEERELTETPSVEPRESTVLGSDVSTRTRSSDTVPRIRTADEYEAYAMRQLSRHAFKGSNTSDL